MSNYIRGEFYRLFHKKSLIIYFIALAVGYVGTMLIRLDTLDAGTLTYDGKAVYPYLLPLVGGFLFATIYTDDLNSKNLITLVGFGLEKTKIVMSKFILTATTSACIYAFVPLWSYGVLALFGHPATMSSLGIAYAYALKNMLATLIYVAIASVLVYGLQRPTFALVTYILLALNFISAMVLLLMKLRVFEEIASKVNDYLVDGVTTNIFLGLTEGGSLALPLLQFVGYIAVFGLLSILAFKKKEMEF
ncbi:MAG: hypothetical protein LBC58_03440 [Clostridiales Family XIII bacterium]|jgi:ABC-type transport system involved in multi-copper enzyme maturation permease subunit|nr:hypothetical protein [Clostridiales Family XIII bacterium]